MVKTIIFDIGGVVTRTDFKVIYSNFSKRIGLSSDFVSEYIKSNVDDMLLGNITLDQFLGTMRNAGADRDADLAAVWLEEGVKNQEVNNELLSIVKILRSHYTVGVLTNLTPVRLLLDQEVNLYSHFDYSVLSCEEGLKKPNPNFYRRALEIAQVKPEEAIFVDDKESCNTAAEAVGIKSILYSYPDNKRLLGDLMRLGISARPV